MKENIIMEKSFAFSVRIVNLHKYLSNVKKEEDPDRHLQALSAKQSNEFLI